MAPKRTKKSILSNRPVTVATGEIRTFRTLHFAKAARGAGIGKYELCEAANELAKGQGDALGAGVWKKRLDKNRYRSIVIAKAGEFWVFAYLFAKSDRENITPKELTAFKKLAKDYGVLDKAKLAMMLKNGELEEIYDECEKD